MSKEAAISILERLAPDPTTSYTAMDAACRLLSFGIETTVDASIDGIQSSNRDVAILSLHVLQWIVSQKQFGETPLKVIPATASVLGHKDRLVRVSAIHAIGEFGQLASEAVPALLSIVRTDEEYLRVLAAAAVLKVTPDNQEQMQSILEAAMDSGNPMCAYVARESLGVAAPEDARLEH